MKKEEYEIKDMAEYERQRKELILKEGNYARIEIIVPKIEKENKEGTQPVISTELAKVGVQEVAMLLLALENTFNTMKKKFPMEYMMGKVMYGVTDLGTAEYERKDKEEK